MPISPVSLAIKSLAARLIESAVFGSRSNRVDYFQQSVQPLFNDAKIVFDDYEQLFGELLVRLSDQEPMELILDWLEERRRKQWPLRVKIRALVAMPHLSDEDLSKFEKGIWGILKGAASAIESGHAQAPEYGSGDHTVVDLMQEWKKRSKSPDYDRLVRSARRQREALRDAWEDVASGFAEKQHELVGESIPAARRQRRSRRDAKS
jgi:hypothetical protein